MGFQRTSAQLSKEIDALQKHIFNAKAHYDIFTGLRKSWPQYINEISCSPCFWQLTMRAHIDNTVLHLCRIYDPDVSTLGLPKLLDESIQKNPNLFSETEFRKRLKDEPNRDVESLVQYQRDLNHEQLKKDVWFCSEKNPLVKNLLEWRNNVVAHFNYKEAVNPSEPFHKKYPLLYEDIQKLIDEAFSIVNSYSSLFRAQMHSEQFASKQHKDYLFVLDSIKARLDAEFFCNKMSSATSHLSAGAKAVLSKPAARARLEA
jgi:hypothetical protein